MNVRKSTLCWECENACGGCSWSDYWLRTPVPGWEAEVTTLRLNNNEYCNSYIVESCPEFRRDRPRKKQKFRRGHV